MDLACDFIPMRAYWIGILSDLDTKISDHVQNDIRYPNELDHDIYARAISQKLIR